MQNCGSFSVLLFLIMALFLTFPNIFFTFGKKNIINYGYPMMKGWRIIMLKGDRVQEKKKEEENYHSFWAIVSNLLCKISKKVPQLCAVMFPRLTLLIDFCSFTDTRRHCDLASVIEWGKGKQLLKYIYLCTIPQCSDCCFMFFSFWSLCTVELTQKVCIIKSISEL